MSRRPLLGLLLLCLEAAPAHAALCPEACRRWPDYCSYALMAEHGAPGTCILPPFPSIGDYSIVDISPRGTGAADFSLAYSCPAGYRLLGVSPRCADGVWSAAFPSCITASLPAVSAGFANGKKCSKQQFLCADGACVGRERRCDGTPDCADGSDERACADSLTSQMCVLPAYPRHGTYSVLNNPFAAPGQVFATAKLIVTCDPGFEVMGSNSTYCFYGTWSKNKMPLCSQCGTPAVPSGQRLRRSKNSPHAHQGEIPWHAGIYSKAFMPYMQICVGSLVSTTIVISAATCFWDVNNGQISASEFAVGIGKIYRPWNEHRDLGAGAHRSNVTSIKIPVRYRGHDNSFQDNIALVVLSSPVVYSYNIRPVCLDFSVEFDRTQLESGGAGKAAGWGSESEDGAPSQLLKIMELVYVDEKQCIDILPYLFLSYYTTGHLCARVVKGAVCRGDTGDGVAFSKVDSHGSQRYYLRGVVSTVLAPEDGHTCSVIADTNILLTHVLKHETFIEKHLNNSYV